MNRMKFLDLKKIWDDPEPQWYLVVKSDYLDREPIPFLEVPANLAAAKQSKEFPNLWAKDEQMAADFWMVKYWPDYEMDECIGCLVIDPNGEEWKPWVFARSIYDLLEKLGLPHNWKGSRHFDMDVQEIEMLRQTAGILCEECGHRFIRLPGESCLNCFVFSDPILMVRFLNLST